MSCKTRKGVVGKKALGGVVRSEFPTSRKRRFVGRPEANVWASTSWAERDGRVFRSQPNLKKLAAPTFHFFSFFTSIRGLLTCVCF